MLTVVENIRKEKNANLCYVEDAIIGNGPFELAPEFTHFNVDQFSWTYHWSVVDFLFLQLYSKLSPCQSLLDEVNFFHHIT